jgi:RNA polymerase sigma factor (TIGR02999 family)
MGLESVMETTSTSLITQRLVAWSNGDLEALEGLMHIVYNELRRLANHYLRSERPDHTLQPTALVHEAYLRLTGQKQVHWQNRAHFFGVAAQMMRRVLVDHARANCCAKRGGAALKLSFEETMNLYQRQDQQLVELDEALTRLREIDSRKSEVVELRYFGGMSVEETAEVLGVSCNTVMRDWNMAKAWLYQELKKND